MSKGLGTWKAAAELLATVRDRFDGGADNVFVASSLASIGGINSGTIGGGRVSMYNDDPFHSRSSSTMESRSPCGSAAETAPSRELQDSNTTSTENNTDGDVLLVYKERMPRRNLFSCFLFCNGWCDNGARCTIGDSRSANGWVSIFYVSSTVWHGCYGPRSCLRIVLRMTVRCEGPSSSRIVDTEFAVPGSLPVVGGLICSGRRWAGR